jgi:hypothetical protein
VDRVVSGNDEQRAMAGFGRSDRGTVRDRNSRINFRNLDIVFFFTGANQPHSTLHNQEWANIYLGKLHLVLPIFWGLWGIKFQE